MLRAMFSAATGMVAQQTNIDTIANNLANVQTTGFKRSRATFQDLLYETIRLPGTQTSAGITTPEGIQIGHGTRLSAVSKNFAPGSFIQTGNRYDLAIEGDGFFEVTLADGSQAFTRDGSFRINSQGQLMTVDGYLLEPAITVSDDASEVSIGADGTVSILEPGSTTPTTQGPIQLVRFANPAGLDARLGSGLFIESDASGAPTPSNPGEDGAGLLRQRFLENSNVQVVEEIINLIVAQRAYEANSKVIQTSDEMLQVANNVRR